MNNIQIDDKQYTIENLPASSRDLIKKIQFCQLEVEYRKRQLTVLGRSKKSYLLELKNEVLANKAGFDFSE